MLVFLERRYISEIALVPRFCSARLQGERACAIVLIQPTYLPRTDATHTLRKTRCVPSTSSSPRGKEEGERLEKHLDVAWFDPFAHPNLHIDTPRHLVLCVLGQRTSAPSTWPHSPKRSFFPFSSSLLILSATPPSFHYFLGRHYGLYSPAATAATTGPPCTTWYHHPVTGSAFDCILDQQAVAC